MQKHHFGLLLGCVFVATRVTIVAIVEGHHSDLLLIFSRRPQTPWAARVEARGRPLDYLVLVCSEGDLRLVPRHPSRPPAASLLPPGLELQRRIHSANGIRGVTGRSAFLAVSNEGGLWVALGHHPAWGLVGGVGGKLDLAALGGNLQWGVSCRSAPKKDCYKANKAKSLHVEKFSWVARN